MTTYDLPPEPPIGTRLVDKDGDVWERYPSDYWGAPDGCGSVNWTDLLDERGPLTEAPTPALPTEPGTVIRATGQSDRASFEDAVLVLDRNGYWRGDIYGGFIDTGPESPLDTIDAFTVLDTHDPATQAVVPRAEWEALKSEVRSVVASAGADLDPDPYIARKARALVRAAEEAQR